MKLLVDMNLSPRWIKRLAEDDIEATHWSRIGPLDAADSVIMAFARTHGFTVLTNDLDFGAILAASQSDKPSVVQIRADDVSPDVIGGSVIAALRQAASAIDEGALLTIDSDRSRLRILPLLRKS